MLIFRGLTLGHLTTLSCGIWIPKIVYDSDESHFFSSSFFLWKFSKSISLDYINLYVLFKTLKRHSG